MEINEIKTCNFVFRTTKKVDDVLIAVSNPTLSNPTKLSDVVTSEDVLKEVNLQLQIYLVEHL